MSGGHYHILWPWVPQSKKYYAKKYFLLSILNAAMLALIPGSSPVFSLAGPFCSIIFLFCKPPLGRFLGKGNENILNKMFSINNLSSSFHHSTYLILFWMILLRCLYFYCCKLTWAIQKVVPPPPPPSSPLSLSLSGFLLPYPWLTTLGLQQLMHHLHFIIILAAESMFLL